ncbi:MAG: bifunctional demethylmenaquinone methyltransferase/2-methoxy-6-polyprenyl-1,4-benzoquinol methylase UbiE [Muribaculaceae bacterium]|nr:bifunctional demethylmenaquinone methyltransferase/2-methoxy-6-polyprenyl-1,4-benzoquinol methylase UbiE [Muribaculaceae bacterium]
MEIKAEKVMPYGGDSRAKGLQVRDMFDSIAPAYDFMNRAMTLGIDRLWRRRAVSRVAREEPARILDIATGTGDMAIAMARRMPGAEVEGIDLSEGMVAVGCRKVERAGLGGRVTLRTGDSMDLPLPDAAVDAVTVAFGVRNFEHLARGYAEMMRVLRPGGVLWVLELSTPRGRLTAPLYRLYTRTVIPALGRLVSRDVRAYSYLPESIAAVPQGADMCALMLEAGASEASFRSMTFGACTLYVAKK